MRQIHAKRTGQLVDDITVGLQNLIGLLVKIWRLGLQPAQFRRQIKGIDATTIDAANDIFARLFV